MNDGYPRVVRTVVANDPDGEAIQGAVTDEDDSMVELIVGRVSGADDTLLVVLPNVRRGVNEGLRIPGASQSHEEQRQGPVRDAQRGGHCCRDKK